MGALTAQVVAGASGPPVIRSGMFPFEAVGEFPDFCLMEAEAIHKGRQGFQHGVLRPATPADLRGAF